MEKNEISLETFNANISSKNELAEQAAGLKEFNNVETADRKLILNKDTQFWIHDDILSSNSDYFAELLHSKEQEAQDIPELRIEVPHHVHFFDILIWIYTKDSRKLKKASKNFHSFIYVLSLGTHLKLKPAFFDILLSRLSFQWKNSYFEDPAWSKTVFTFPVLERIVDDMKAENTTKVIALLSWLKEVEGGKVKDSQEAFDPYANATEMFLVRNYIRNQKLMSGIELGDLQALTQQFSQFLLAFDTNTILQEFIYSSARKIYCQICKKEFESPHTVTGECKTEFFHPKCHLKSDKNNLCNHDGCFRKTNKSESSAFTCCHKVNQDSKGCISGDGKHQILLL